jgi:hypothetical protein
MTILAVVGRYQNFLLVKPFFGCQVEINYLVTQNKKNQAVI